MGLFFLTGLFCLFIELTVKEKWVTSYSMFWFSMLSDLHSLTENSSSILPVNDPSLLYLSSFYDLKILLKLSSSFISSSSSLTKISSLEKYST